MSPQQKERNILKIGPGVLFREGVDSFSKGNAKAAMQHFRQVLRQSKRTGDKTNMAWSLLHMGMVLRGQRQYAEVIQILEQARTIFIELDNKFGLASVFQELSLANRELDRNALALEYAHQAVRMFKELGRTLELAWAYDNLSVIHFNLYHRHEILTYAKKARAIFLEFNSHIGLAWNACNLAGLYMDMGFPSRAERYYTEALNTFTKLRSKQGMAWSLLGLATVTRGQYQYKAAAAHLVRAKGLYHDLGLKDREGWCLLNEAAIKRVMGQENDAMSVNKKALQLFSPLRNHDGVAWCLFQIGQLYRDRGQFVKAWQTLREALNLHTDISNRKGIAWSENEWGKAYIELNDQSHARECFIKAKVIADQLDEGPLKAEVDKNLARLNIDEGLMQRATGFLEQTRQLCEKLSSRETEAEVYIEQMRASIVIGDMSAADKASKKVDNLIKTYNINRLKPMLRVYQAEILLSKKKKADAVRALTEGLKSAQAVGHRRVQAEALVGLSQIALKDKKTQQLNSYLSQLEKDVRILSSRKIKAKYLIIKNMASFQKNKSIDTRLLTQSIQILRSSGLVVLEKQCLEIIIDLYDAAGKPKEKVECQEQLSKLLSQGTADLRLARPRKDISPDVLISLTA